MAAPAADLIRHRELVDAQFGGGGQHDVAEFVMGLLERMRDGEVSVGRSAPWPQGVLSARSTCTHVDRLFAHLREDRSRCVVCGKVTVKFAAATVLELPLPAVEQLSPSVTDLYVEYCKLQQSSEDGTTVFCDGECKKRTERWVQGRVAREPNVLLVQVRRCARDGRVRRFPVQIEEQLTLPDLPPLELSSGYPSCQRVPCRAPTWRCSRRWPT